MGEVRPVVCRKCRHDGFAVSYDEEIVLLVCQQCGYIYFVMRGPYRTVQVVDVDLMEE